MSKASEGQKIPAEADFTEELLGRVSPRGWTRYRLAQESGVSESRVGEWLAGKREMQTANLEKIAGALGLELRDVSRKRRRPSS